MRDVWAASAASVDSVVEEGILKTSPPLSEAGVDEDGKGKMNGAHGGHGVKNQSLVSPPVTPLRKNLS